MSDSYDVSLSELRDELARLKELIDASHECHHIKLIGQFVESVTAVEELVKDVYIVHFRALAAPGDEEISTVLYELGKDQKITSEVAEGILEAQIIALSCTIPGYVDEARREEFLAKVPLFYDIMKKLMMVIEALPT